MTEETSYKEDIKIDKFALDFAWEQQPTLFLKWAERHIQALQEQDRAKEQLDLKRAELDKAIRSNPKNFGLPERVTEGAISNTILQQDEYRQALDKFHEAKEYTGIMSIAREAMVHKKKALEMLAQLWLGKYPPSQPHIPEEAREAASLKGRKKQTDALEASMNRRSRL